MPLLQENPSVWLLKATLLWSLLIAVVFYLVQLAAVFCYIEISHITIPNNNTADFFADIASDGNVLSYCTFATAVLCSLLVFGIIKLKKGITIKQYLGFNPVTRPMCFQWIASLVLLLLLSDALTLLLGKDLVPEVMVNIYASAQPKILIWLALLVAAPLFEEIFFRGFILTGLSASCAGTSGAIVISAALWSLMHIQYDLYGVATIFIIGLFLGFARMKTGSILLTFGLHALANLFSVFETMFVLSN